MSEVFVGLLQQFPFNWAPRGWMICNGSLVSISQYQALFALIGTTYGGDGVTNFAIPDTRGRTLLGQGQIAGGGRYEMGQASGAEAYTLTLQNLSMHNHLLFASIQGANAAAPGMTVSLATSNGSDPTSGDAVNVQIYGPSGTNQPLQGIMPVGGNQAISLMQPYLVNNYCIAVEGIYPSRN